MEKIFQGRVRKFQGELKKYLQHPVLSVARGSSYPPYFLRVPSRHVAPAKPQNILRISLQVTLY